MSQRHITTLDHLLGSRVRARLVVALLKEPGRHPCFRDLAREAGPGVSFVRRETAMLERMGLIRHTRAGGALRFDVVTCHPLYAPLRELIRAAARLDGDAPQMKGSRSPYGSLPYASLPYESLPGERWGDRAR